MLDILNFYSKEQIKNGGFESVIDELVNNGYSYEDSIKATKKHFKLR
jgi:hypothetical protein